MFHYQKFNKKKNYVIRMVLTFICLSLIFGIILQLLLFVHKFSFENEIKIKQELQLQTITTSIENTYSHINIFIFSLCDLLHFHKIHEAESIEQLHFIEDEFLALVSRRKDIRQLRFVDNTGQEIIRLANRVSVDV